jgi:hypothetical protein
MAVLAMRQPLTTDDCISLRHGALCVPETARLQRWRPLKFIAPTHQPVILSPEFQDEGPFLFVPRT